MTKTVQARFDGKAFYPEEPIPIAPNTMVLLTVETPERVEAERPDAKGAMTGTGEPYSFLKLARTLNLEGPEGPNFLDDETSSRQVEPPPGHQCPG